MFDAFKMMRQIRDDRDLTTTEKAILLCAAVRADRTSGEVYAGQEKLAKDAGVSASTIKRFYRSDAFIRYFVMEKRHRLVIMTFRTSGVIVTPLRCHGDTPSTYSSTPSTTPEASIRDVEKSTEQMIEDIEAQLRAL